MFARDGGRPASRGLHRRARRRRAGHADGRRARRGSSASAASPSRRARSRCSARLFGRAARRRERSGALRALGAPVVPDAVAGRGAPGGLHAALSAAATPWVFAAGCDMPFLDADAIALARRAARRAPTRCSSAPAAASSRSTRSGRAPACRSSRGSSRRASRRSATSPRACARAIVEEAEWRTVDPDGRAFENANTPEDARGSGSKRPADRRRCAYHRALAPTTPFPIARRTFRAQSMRMPGSDAPSPRCKCDANAQLLDVCQIRPRMTRWSASSPPEISALPRIGSTDSSPRGTRDAARLSAFAARSSSRPRSRPPSPAPRTRGRARRSTWARRGCRTAARRASAATASRATGSPGARELRPRSLRGRADLRRGDARAPCSRTCRSRAWSPSTGATPSPRGAAGPRRFLLQARPGRRRGTRAGGSLAGGGLVAVRSWLLAVLFRRRMPPVGRARAARGAEGGTR